MPSDSRRNHRIADRTWPELERLLAAARVAIVPLGACEQHGHGMAMRTDSTRAELVADLVAEQLAGQAVVTPVIPIGVSEHHMGFPGTLTLSPETLVAVIRDVVDSLARHGVRRVFVLTGHGGNNSTVDVAIASLRRSHPDLLLAWSGLSPLAADVTARFGVSDVHGHSGESETAQALFLDPTLVTADQLAKGSAEAADLDAAGRLSRSINGIHFPQRYDSLSRTGGLGDPRDATAEFGEELVATIVGRLSTFLTTFSSLEPTHPTGEADAH